MIAASALLVVVALVTLIIGIFQSGLGLIWVSIASSVLAAIFLLLGVVQGRPKVVVAGGPQPSTGGWGDTSTGVLEHEPSSYAPAYEEPEPMPEIAPPMPEVRPARPAPRPAARPSTSRPAASRASSSARTPAGQASVVVIPDRDKFHRASCRYANNPAAMTMSKTEARREGYKACGVCKP